MTFTTTEYSDAVHYVLFRAIFVCDLTNQRDFKVIKLN